MRHAMEADHVAAMATLVSRTHVPGKTLRLALSWGLGHTLTLLLFGSAVWLFQFAISERLALLLEFAVGVMLVGLGLDVLLRMLRDRVHFHTHGHTGGTQHFHAHAHAGETQHDTRHHEHAHPEYPTLRALLVGLMHGMAGSAALIMLSLQTFRGIGLGVLYIALFGLGSMVGMALLSVVISYPLRLTADRLTSLYAGLRGTVSAVSIAIGAWIIVDCALHFPLAL